MQELKHRYMTLAVALLIPIAACGKKSKDEDPAPSDSPVLPTDDSPTVSSAVLSSDTEASTGLVSNNMEELVASLNSGDSSNNGTTAAGLVAVPLADSTITRDRKCVADATAKSATVTIGFSGTESKTKGAFTSSEKAAGSEVRVWTNTVSGTAVACTADNNYAKIAWGKVVGVNGLQLVDTSTRSRTITVTYSNKKGVAKTRIMDYADNASRTVNWSTPAAATDTLTTSKTIKSTNVRTFKLTKENGVIKDLSATHATKDANPLTVTVVRDDKGNPVSHTIATGTMSVAKTGSFYVENTFKDLVYNLASTDPCVPSSGSITTNIYKSNAAADIASPVKTLTITFAGGAATVVGDDVASQHMNNNINHKCDFNGGD